MYMLVIFLILFIYESFALVTLGKGTYTLDEYPPCMDTPLDVDYHLNENYAYKKEGLNV